MRAGRDHRRRQRLADPGAAARRPGARALRIDLGDREDSATVALDLPVDAARRPRRGHADDRRGDALAGDDGDDVIAAPATTRSTPATATTTSAARATTSRRDEVDAGGGRRRPARARRDRRHRRAAAPARTRSTPTRSTTSRSTARASRGCPRRRPRRAARPGATGRRGSAPAARPSSARPPRRRQARRHLVRARHDRRLRVRRRRRSLAPARADRKRVAIGGGGVELTVRLAARQRREAARACAASGAWSCACGWSAPTRRATPPPSARRDPATRLTAEVLTVTGNGERPRAARHLDACGSRGDPCRGRSRVDRVAAGGAELEALVVWGSRGSRGGRGGALRVGTCRAAGQLDGGRCGREGRVRGGCRACVGSSVLGCGEVAGTRSFAAHAAASPCPRTPPTSAGRCRRRRRPGPCRRRPRPRRYRRRRRRCVVAGPTVDVFVAAPSPLSVSLPASPAGSRRPPLPSEHVVADAAEHALARRRAGQQVARRGAEHVVRARGPPQAGVTLGVCDGRRRQRGAVRGRPAHASPSVSGGVVARRRSRCTLSCPRPEPALGVSRARVVVGRSPPCRRPVAVLDRRHRVVVRVAEARRGADRRRGRGRRRRTGAAVGPRRPAPLRARCSGEYRAEVAVRGRRSGARRRWW